MPIHDSEVTELEVAISDDLIATSHGTSKDKVSSGIEFTSFGPFLGVDDSEVQVDIYRYSQAGDALIEKRDSTEFQVFPSVDNGEQLTSKDASLEPTSLNSPTIDPDSDSAATQAQGSVQAQAASRHPGIEPTTGGRTLRPRTYRQLHTYEYEHAKYVLECRAAGIQPVKFDGTRYREMDKTDKDFVLPADIPYRPTRQASSSSHESGGVSVLQPAHSSSILEDSDDLNAKRKRKSTWKAPKFKDPRLISEPHSRSPHIISEATEAVETDTFDFPDDHWQADLSVLPPSSPDLVQSVFLSPPIGPSEVSSKVRAAPILIDSASSDESFSSKDSEAAAKAQFARKLKGILPPSYLSRKIESYYNKLPAAKRMPVVSTRRHIVPQAKGLAKKKISTIAVSPFSSGDQRDPEELSSSGDSPATDISYLNGRPTNRNIHDNDDIPEGEDPIDRMLPSNSRANNRTSKVVQHPRRSRKQVATEVFLPDIVHVRGKSGVPKEMRLACRTIKKKHSVGTHLERKLLDFHDRPPRTAYTALSATSGASQTLQPKAVESGDSSDDPQQTLIKWKDNRMTYPTRARNIESARSRKMQDRHQQQTTIRNTSAVRPAISSNKKRKIEDSLYLRQLPRKKVLSASSGSPTADRDQSLHAGFFLNSSDDEESPMPALHMTTKSVETPKPVQQLRYMEPVTSGLFARTFETNPEHETGKYATIRSANTNRARKLKYLQKFDQIKNIFSTELDHVSKVSQWQANQLEVPLDSSRMSCRAKERSAKHHRKKGNAKRLALKQVSILPFVATIAEKHIEDTQVDFSRVSTDVLLGAEPATTGSFFTVSTFLGTSGLVRVLASAEERRFIGCYISNRHLSDSNFDEGVDYGFTAVDAMINALRRDIAPPEDKMVAIYDFFRYLTAIGRSEIQLLESVLDKFDRLRFNIDEQINRQGGTHQSIIDVALRISNWCITFHLSVAYLLAQSPLMDKQAGQIVLNQVLDRTILGLLQAGFDQVSRSLRRQRHSALRAQGMSISLQDSALESWIVALHVAQITEVSFWKRINAALEINKGLNTRVSERAWSVLLQLSSVTRFDMTGHIQDQCIPNWEAVEVLLRAVFENYSLVKVQQKQDFDQYIRILLRRVHALIDLWRWPGCSALLGHGRTGGVLHDFFFRDLGLGNLSTEIASQYNFPAFFSFLDREDCLQYNNDSKESAFNIFLTVVCSGIRQYIDGLKPTDVERSKKRGIGIVDKFATHGRLSYSANESIDMNTVNEVQNRFALEIAVYWSAASWKDRGISRMIDASKAAMAGSHLSLRTISTRAFEIVAKLQVHRAEEQSLPETVLWLTSIVQATVSDVLQFQHQFRLCGSDAESRNQIGQNLRKCRRNLLQAFEAYLSVLSYKFSASTAHRIQTLWSNDVLRAVLQLHESFIVKGQSTKLIDIVFRIVTALTTNITRSSCEQDSQDYGDIIFSQDEAQSTDDEKRIDDKLCELAELVFQYLTNISAQEKVTTTNKVLAKLGIRGFVQVLLATRSRGGLQWPELFSERGKYSWVRLLDTPMKTTTLPYYIAMLIEADSSFYAVSCPMHITLLNLMAQEMYPLILSIWLSSLSESEVKDSLAALTAVLIGKGSEHVSVDMISDKTRSAQISTSLVDTNRTDFIVHALRILGITSPLRTNEAKHHSLPLLAIQALASTLQSTYISITAENAAKRAVYLNFLQKVLSAIHQHCASILRTWSTEQRAAIDWLSDSANVPQVRDDFSIENFRSYALQDISRKGLEICLHLLARCDVYLTDGGNDLSDFLVDSIGNNPLHTETAPSWDETIAKLRCFILGNVTGILCSLRSSFEAAALYIGLLNAAACNALQAVFEQSWPSDQRYILALTKECISIYCQLSAYEEAANIILTCQQILTALHNFSCLDSTARIMVHEIMLGISQPSTALCPPESLVKALKDHLTTTWAVIDAGLYHNKRKVTIPFPSHHVNKSSNHSIALVSHISSDSDVLLHIGGEGLDELHI